uniref:Uncharacterized protein n=1 Tax=Anguilla anguilla TaxID=7936 RepID=A0A0E9PI73_ANGAN
MDVFSNKNSLSSQKCC